MRGRRAAALTAAALLGTSLLTGCSAGVNGVPGIGFDADGQLVGGIKVCRTDTGSASLGGYGYTVAEWERSQKGHGTETWRLTSAADGQWRQQPPEPSRMDRSDPLVFRVASWGHGWYSAVQVTARQLAAVPPGHLLVDVDLDARGHAIARGPRLIAIDELADQPCPPP